MKKLLIIPDLHGRYDLLEKLINKYSLDDYYYIQLGDMIDRGTGSKDIIKKFKELNEKGLAEVSLGNHEELFLDFLEYPSQEGIFYFDNGGDKTVNSFLDEKVAYKKDMKIISNEINEKYKDEIQFLKELPNYIVKGKWVFVHAGVDFNLVDWRNTSESQFTWMNYKRFVYLKNETGHNFVVGHTHTYMVNRDQSNDPWASECKTKFMLDGNAVKTGVLNIMIIDQENNNFEFKKVD